MFVRNEARRNRRRIVIEDRKSLEPRARRFLNGYLSATNAEKGQFHEAAAGASDGCQPRHQISCLDSLRRAEMAAGLASNVVRGRLANGKDGDTLERLITDAYATAAVAYRRASGMYVDDQRMQRLGTAAVHLLTIAKSALASVAREGIDN